MQNAKITKNYYITLCIIFYATHTHLYVFVHVRITERGVVNICIIIIV